MYIRVALSVCLLLPFISCSDSVDDEDRETSRSDVLDESPPRVLTRASSPSEALRLLPVSIGDRVRIVPSEITDDLHISGKTGEVIRVADSASGATVYIKELEQKFGLSSNLLELTDLPAGTDISMGDRKWVSNQNGEWVEVESD